MPERATLPELTIVECPVCRHQVGLPYSGELVPFHAFPDQRKNSGTWDFVRRALRAGYEPLVHEIEVVMPRG